MSWTSSLIATPTLPMNKSIFSNLYSPYFPSQNFCLFYHKTAILARIQEKESENLPDLFADHCLTAEIGDQEVTSVNCNQEHCRHDNRGQDIDISDTKEGLMGKLNSEDRMNCC